jgi:xanthine/CO dehydrogenase XdhC/CoxF family maturation factor
MAEALVAEGRSVGVATVIETWGSAPRSVDSHLVVDAMAISKARSAVAALMVR